jgi:hypothetical protein
MCSITEIKRRADIRDVWAALGGGKLRGSRGQAFWRRGDGYNVAIHAGRGTWHDFVSGEGGDVIALVETVRQCDFKAAVQWLADHLGVNLSPVPGRRATPRDTDWASDLRSARWWRIAARACAETLLESLPDYGPERRGLMSLINDISLGPASLVSEFRHWRQENPRLTWALVRAGRLSDARLQRRLARWLMERERG